MVDLLSYCLLYLKKANLFFQNTFIHFIKLLYQNFLFFLSTILNISTTLLTQNIFLFHIHANAF